MDRAIQLAAERMLNLTVDEDVITAYNRMFMASCDRTSEINFALSKGREEGLEEGREKAHEEDRQYFLELLNQGLTIEEIKQRLSREEDFPQS